MMENVKHHVSRNSVSSEYWDAIFSKTEDEKLGWYETDLTATFSLMEHIKGWQAGADVFVSGAGTSMLVDELLRKKAQLVVNDISLAAIEKTKARLGKKAGQIMWLCQDISHPINAEMPKVDIWIDRAVLHFLTDEESIKGYFNNVKTHVKVGGYVVFAEFSKQGAKQCAGLSVHQYTVDELSVGLGEGFELVSHFDHVYINPWNEERAYIYALFRAL